MRNSTPARTSTRAPGAPGHPSRSLWVAGGLFVLALTTLFAAVNWHWLRANVVTYGWDRLDHLITSFVYRDTLQELTPSSLLAALAYSDYYPPLVHYGSVLLYPIFGVDEDVAPMVNVLYLYILLAATFWIAAFWQSCAGAGGHFVQPPAGPASHPETPAQPEAFAPYPATSASPPAAPAPAPGASGRSNQGRPPSPFWTGALAATLLGLFPIVFAMSRYLYLDFALTALVALSLAFLLASDRFDRRGPALGFGLALGLAFLVKWTAAAFVIGPLLYLVLRSGALPYAWRHPRALLPAWRWLFFALAAGLGAVGAWFALAADVVVGLRLGWWLLPPLGFLLAGVFYALFAPQRPPAWAAGHGDGRRRLRNMLGAAAVAAFLIAAWYLTNVEFLDYFLFTAYGREEQPFYAFGKYLREVFNEQLGPWFALVFAIVAVTWAWGTWRSSVRRRTAGAARETRGAPAQGDRHAQPAAQWARLVGWAGGWSDVAWVLLLWVVVPYFVFSFRVTLAHSRFLMPFLPPFAIWIAVGLLRWVTRQPPWQPDRQPPRPPVLRWSVVALVVGVGLLQYALISFDELAPWRTPLQLEVRGQSLNLLANGFFIQYPTRGVTDPGYAVAPAVLAFVDGQRLAGGALEGKEVVNLGLLVNSYQVHEKHFLYAIYKDFPNVRLRELARNWRDQAAYNQLFDMDYVLVSDTHTFRTNANSQQVVQRILHNPADAFNQAFAPVAHWTLPSGEQLALYGRRFPALEPGISPADTQALLTYFGDRLGPGDVLVPLSPDQVYMLGLAFPADTGAAIAPLPIAAPLRAGGKIETQTVARLQDLASTHNRIFLLGHNVEQVDPNGIVEAWLRANTVPGVDQWAGSIRVTPFVPLPAAAAPAGAAATEAGTAGAGTTGAAPAAGSPAAGAAPLNTTVWPEGPALAQAVVQPGGQPGTPTAGGALVVTLRWAERDEAAVAAAASAAADVPLAAASPSLRKASLQLLGPDGALAAQEDRELAPGEQQYVLLIPRSAAPGDYRLVLVVYDPATGRRLPTAAGGDRAELGMVAVGPAPLPAPVAFPPLRHPEDAEDEGS